MAPRATNRTNHKEVLEALAFDDIASTIAFPVALIFRPQTGWLTDSDQRSDELVITGAALDKPELMVVAMMLVVLMALGLNAFVVPRP